MVEYNVNWSLIIGGNNMFERPEYLNQLIKFKDTDFIKVITGVRRSGKSVLLMLFQEHLIKEGVPDDHIIYMNFESF